MERQLGANVTWLPFDLHPEYPPEGLPRAELIARYGPAMTERMRAFFAARGLDYNPNPAHKNDVVTFDFPYMQQRRRVPVACSTEAASAAPASIRRIIHFRTAQGTRTVSPRYQHLA